MACGGFFWWLLIWKFHTDRCASCSPAVRPTNWSSLGASQKHGSHAGDMDTLINNTRWCVFTMKAVSETICTAAWYCLLLWLSNEVFVLTEYTHHKTNKPRTNCSCYITFFPFLTFSLLVEIKTALMVLSSVEPQKSYGTLTGYLKITAHIIIPTFSVTADWLLYCSLYFLGHI